MFVGLVMIRYTSGMMTRKERWLDRKSSKKEAALLFGGAYGAVVALGNVALALVPYSHINATREYARDDDLSRTVSDVASAMAGYDVDVACTNDVSIGEERDEAENRTMGEVVRYVIVFPPFDPIDAPLNPRAMRIHSSLCDAIDGQADYLSPLEARQDAARAYAYILHELVHLDYPSYDETMTQCTAIDIMPERLESIGVEQDAALWATQYADELTKRRQSSEYHAYPCPE